jgi:hypothetical protein
MTGLRDLDMAGELERASFHPRILDDLLSTCHFVALFVPRCTILPARIYTPAQFLHCCGSDVMLHIDLLRNISVAPST